MTIVTNVITKISGKIFWKIQICDTPVLFHDRFFWLSVSCYFDLWHQRIEIQRFKYIFFFRTTHKVVVVRRQVVHDGTTQRPIVPHVGNTPAVVVTLTVGKTNLVISNDYVHVSENVPESQTNGQHLSYGQDEDNDKQPTNKIEHKCYLQV